MSTQATNKTYERTVFAHKDQNNNYKLESGIYISDPNTGDKYGDFKFYQGRGAIKYQRSDVAKLEFDRASLNTLKDTYHKTSSPTSFLSGLLALHPEKDFDQYQKNPSLFSYLPPLNQHSNAFLIFPNLPYIETPSLLDTPTTMKDSREGIAICAYAVHPNQDLSLIQHIENKSQPNNTNTSYSNDIRTANEIESGTTVKYLTSILDLDAGDIPLLEGLREHMLEHLTQVYNINIIEDKVQLFFHFPVAEVTATLHLHARVNKADHPLNEARSFPLSEVIETLKNGSSIIDMILTRNNGIYYTEAETGVSQIQNIPNKGIVKNPFILDLSQPFEKHNT
ncbi:hypothetical protein [Pseudomonas fluorescens]|uniref:hypothetical protein n=1 Tax=Pseudomonas fluorescens TaxID=294 RepID=UPI0027821C1E|nr:hypothetical protein [Pseudomonas fluorescens]MDP9781094.1 hypothetical protein [Pseudomonas fluorescens]